MHPRHSRLPLRLLAALALATALLTLASAPSRAAVRGIRLFGDSPSGTLWDASWGYFAAPGWVALANGSHFPVDTLHAFEGRNALRLTWVSASGGDWMLAAATAGWAPVDPSAMDSLLFVVWSPVAIAANDLPDVLLEDSNNARTARQHLAAYVPAGVPASTWTRVSVPLAAFRAAPGAANLASVNKLFFAQATTNTSGLGHLMIVDELRYVTAEATVPSLPALVSRAFERHAEVRWDALAHPELETVRIERRDGATWKRLGDAHAEDGTAVDWLGAAGVAATYRASAFDWHFGAVTTSDSVTASTREMGDDEWLDMAEEAAFRWFWLHAHPVSGLARERYGSGDLCATGGTGMSLMAMVVGAERGYVTREQAADRVLHVLQFYFATPPKYQGAFAHWLNGTTGVTVPADAPDDPSGDIVETSYLAQGMLVARQYFDRENPTEQQIRVLATSLWQGIDWNAYRPAGSNAVDWLWSPLHGFANSFAVSGWNECVIVYLLAKASPTHPIPAICYTTGWSRNGAMQNGNSYYGHRLWVGTAYGGPMFFAHYSFMGFDPRDKRDRYANYFQNNRNHALIQSDYSAANPYGFAGYSADAWGLTASDDPNGYAVHAPFSGDNGTLAPTAALASMPYTHVESLRALKGMYRQFGARLLGPFGMVDAFNPGQDWYPLDYIAIDEGPIVVMIENARTGLVWKHFMSNPEIAPMLDSLGFVADHVLDADADAAPPAITHLSLAAPAPNPARDRVRLAYALPRAAHVRASVHDLAGREVARLADADEPAGAHELAWTPADAHGAPLAPGVYLVRVTAGAETATRRIVLLR